MTVNNNNLQKSDKTVWIGSSLSKDPDKIRDLLSVPDAKGILARVLSVRGESFDIYRPTTPLTDRTDVVKTIRQFLSLAATFGDVSLTVIKNAENVPQDAVDFNQVYRRLCLRSGAMDD